MCDAAMWSEISDGLMMLGFFAFAGFAIWTWWVGR